MAHASVMQRTQGTRQVYLLRVQKVYFFFLTLLKMLVLINKWSGFLHASRVTELLLQFLELPLGLEGASTIFLPLNMKL